MGVSGFYFIALVPALVGAAFMRFNHTIVWWEWLIGVGAGLLVAGAMHAIALVGMTDDIETWSGRVNRVIFYPEWVEEYQQMHTRQVANGTDSKGNTTYRTEIYYTTEHRTHHENWEAVTSLGEWEISHAFYNEIAGKFGGHIQKTYTSKSGFYSGDHNTYPCANETDWLQPVSDTFHWTNRVKAAPSVFSFPKVPPTVKVFPWPKTNDRFNSGRSLGATGIKPFSLDQMNARLGPKKHVNVILIGFGSQTRDIAKWQQAAWLGGKKNDFVICFGGAPEKPAWSSVFGWTESDLCKRNVESLVLAQGVTETSLPLIEAEIAKTFRAKDWRKFDYLTIDPPTWSYVTLICVMVATQCGWWWYALHNEYMKSA